MDKMETIIDTEYYAYLLGLLYAPNVKLIFDGYKTIFSDIIITQQSIFDHYKFSFIEKEYNSITKKHSMIPFQDLSLYNDKNKLEYTGIIFNKLSNNHLLFWSFVRGLFESSGKIDPKTRTCSFVLSNLYPIFKNYCKIVHNENDGVVIFNNTNCVDFLSKLYDNSKIRSTENYKLYTDCLGYNVPTCSFVKTLKDAVDPGKNYASDEGYDLTLITVDKKISKNIIRFDTGIKIQPEAGYHIEVMPRSSLSNSGWMLANSIGLIDESYNGNIKVVLVRVDPEAKDIELPFKCVQMVLRRSIHYLFQEKKVQDINDTARSDGGFGSTNIVKQ